MSNNQKGQFARWVLWRDWIFNIGNFQEGRFQSGQMGRTVNPLSFDFGGSNPSLPTLFDYFK